MMIFRFSWLGEGSILAAALMGFVSSRSEGEKWNIFDQTKQQLSVHAYITSKNFLKSLCHKLLLGYTTMLLNGQDDWVSVDNTNLHKAPHTSLHTHSEVTKACSLIAFITSVKRTRVHRVLPCVMIGCPSGPSQQSSSMQRQPLRSTRM